MDLSVICLHLLEQHNGQMGTRTFEGSPRLGAQGVCLGPCNHHCINAYIARIFGEKRVKNIDILPFTVVEPIEQPARKEGKS